VILSVPLALGGRFGLMFRCSAAGKLFPNTGRLMAGITYAALVIAIALS